jgi:hypothetical protein
MKMTAFWDITPCSLVEVSVSEVLTASIIRAMKEITRRTIRVCSKIIYITKFYVNDILMLTESFDGPKL